MTDDGWEARMAARARQRAERREAARLAEKAAADPHRTHHTHLIGTSTVCSCGEYQGVTCVVIDPDEDLSQRACELCGMRGVAGPLNPHYGHHTHARAGTLTCSCGEAMGVICSAPTPDYNPDDDSCDLCGKPGVVRMQDRKATP
ncbi:hypothetical protein [Micromonospora sp. NBC_00421]|uniref:hypothetical protein n=1 Tax=Micromonospora sp. NBC_00421 TaxID=2975976 RepID=UPI002E20EE93